MEAEPGGGMEGQVYGMEEGLETEAEQAVRAEQAELVARAAQAL